MKRRKILIAINCMNIGGAPSVVLAHLRSLDREHFEPWLLTLYPSKQANLLTEARKEVGDNHTVSFSLRRRSPLDLLTLWEIYRFLNREKFDTVITHLFLSNLVVRPLAFIVGTRNIMSYEHSVYPHKSLWQILADRLLVRITRTIVVPSKHIAEFTSKQESIPLSLFTVVPNPISYINIEAVNREALIEVSGAEGRSPIIVSIGRFSEEKGHKFLLEAAALTRKSLPNALFLIIGHGYLEAKLRQECEKLKVGDRVRILALPHQAREFLLIADLFVLPSLREGQSLTLLEALSAGVPVVTTSAGGTVEMVTNEITALLVAPGDARDLADGIARLASDARLRQTLIDNGKRMVKEGYVVQSAAAFQKLLEVDVTKNN